MLDRLFFAAEWAAVVLVGFFFLNKLSYKFWEKFFGYSVVVVIGTLTVGNLINWVVTGNGKFVWMLLPYLAIPWVVSGVMHILKGYLELKKANAGSDVIVTNN